MSSYIKNYTDLNGISILVKEWDILVKECDILYFTGVNYYWFQDLGSPLSFYDVFKVRPFYWGSDITSSVLVEDIRDFISDFITEGYVELFDIHDGIESGLENREVFDLLFYEWSLTKERSY